MTEKYGSVLTVISVFERIPSCLSGIVWIIHTCSHSILCLDGQHVASEISPQHESSWTGCSGEGHTVSLGASSQQSFMPELCLIKYSSSSCFVTGSMFYFFFRLKYELKKLSIVLITDFFPCTGCTESHHLIHYYRVQWKWLQRNKTSWNMLVMFQSGWMSLNAWFLLNCV